LEDLTPKEKRAFLRALVAGELSHFIQPWEPWWVHPLAHTISLTKQGTSLIHPTEGTEPTGVDSSSGTEMDSVSQAGESPSPAPPDKPLQSLKELTTVQPSPLLGVHVTEAIYGYCFTLRLFNGDWRTDPLDAALVLLRVSKSLGDAQSPQSMGAAMAGCLENVCSPAFKHHGGYRFVAAVVSLLVPVDSYMKLNLQLISCSCVISQEIGQSWDLLVVLNGWHCLQIAPTDACKYLSLGWFDG
jgi:hypothetical protein